MGSITEELKFCFYLILILINLCLNLIHHIANGSCIGQGSPRMSVMDRHSW